MNTRVLHIVNGDYYAGAERVQDLRRLGARFQVNHPSFLLPKTSRRGEMARWLYIKGLVDLLGTDLHRATSLSVRHGVRLGRPRPRSRR